MRVVAPARLHLGFLDLNGDLGRRFGSIGLAIDRPATELTLARSSQFDAEGPDAERALAALRRLAGLLGLTGTYRIAGYERDPLACWSRARAPSLLSRSARP